MNSRQRRVRDELRNVFGVSESFTDTATVLTTPSSVTKEQAIHTARKCPLHLMRDLGALAARDMANELEAASLRPSDCVQFQEVIDIVRDRIIRDLLDGPGADAFNKAMAEFLALRG